MSLLVLVAPRRGGVGTEDVRLHALADQGEERRTVPVLQLRVEVRTCRDPGDEGRDGCPTTDHDRAPVAGAPVDDADQTVVRRGDQVLARVQRLGGDAHVAAAVDAEVGAVLPDRDLGVRDALGDLDDERLACADPTAGLAEVAPCRLGAVTLLCGGGAAEGDDGDVGVAARDGGPGVLGGGELGVAVLGFGGGLGLGGLGAGGSGFGRFGAGRLARVVGRAPGHGGPADGAVLRQGTGGVEQVQRHLDRRARFERSRGRDPHVRAVRCHVDPGTEAVVHHPRRQVELDGRGGRRRSGVVEGEHRVRDGGGDDRGAERRGDVSGGCGLRGCRDEDRAEHSRGEHESTGADASGAAGGGGGRGHDDSFGRDRAVGSLSRAVRRGTSPIGDTAWSWGGGVPELRTARAGGTPG